MEKHYVGHDGVKLYSQLCLGFLLQMIWLPSKQICRTWCVASIYIVYFSFEVNCYFHAKKFHFASLIGSPFYSFTWAQSL